MNNYLSFFILLITLSMACNQPETKTDSAILETASRDFNLEKNLLEGHISTLASDEYGGRMPFSIHEEKTLSYLEKYLKALGLEPGNGKSYRQEVPMVEITAIPDDVMTISNGDRVMKLEEKKDFVIHSERPVEEVNVSNSELVFCGYGIVAPEYNWNDYEGLDMKGKTAVVLVNDPGLGSEDSTFFNGNTMTYYGRWTYKYEEADRQGADGLILIHETNMAGYPFYVVTSSWSGPQLHLRDNEINHEDCGIKGWVSLEKAKELFAFSGKELGEHLRSARKPGFKSFSLGSRVTVGLKNELKEDKSENIIAVLKGQERPEEKIIYTAHWDHLGVGDAVEGDSIYNGALDNASGTSSLLLIAEKFIKDPRKPNRSIVFLFVTAEEQGLLGSAWYAENPIFPLSKTVCNINIDGINYIGRCNDLTITGYGQSQMDEIAQAVARKQDRYVQPEQEPEKGYFFRSDHFNFAKSGIPALYAKGGYDHREKGKEYAAEMNEEFRTKHYHQPSDEYVKGAWDLNGALEDAELYFNVGQALGNSTLWPKWKDGSSFKSKDPRNREE